MRMQGLMAELLAHLATADSAFAATLADAVARLVLRFAPRPRWYLDNLMAILVVAGTHVAVRCCPLAAAASAWPVYCSLPVPQ